MNTPAATRTPMTGRPDLAEVEPLIGGMARASRAARVEEKLDRTDGVTATVDFAAEKARVAHPAGVSVADPIATAEKTPRCSR